MNPLDRNVIDKMASLGILPISDTVIALQKNIDPSKFTTSFNVQGDFHNSDITKIGFLRILIASLFLILGRLLNGLDFTLNLEIFIY